MRPVLWAICFCVHPRCLRRRARRCPRLVAHINRLELQLGLGGHGLSVRVGCLQWGGLPASSIEYYALMALPGTALRGLQTGISHNADKTFLKPGFVVGFVVRRRVCRREVLTIGLKNRREVNAAVPPCYLGTVEPQPGVLFLPFGDGKAAKGMQRQNIAVNRLCTGNGSTEAE